MQSQPDGSFSENFRESSVVKQIKQEYISMISEAIDTTFSKNFDDLAGLVKVVYDKEIEKIHQITKELRNDIKASSNCAHFAPPVVDVFRKFVADSRCCVDSFINAAAKISKLKMSAIALDSASHIIHDATSASTLCLGKHHSGYCEAKGNCLVEVFFLFFPYLIFNYR